MPYHNSKASGSGKIASKRSVARTGSSTKALRPQSGTKQIKSTPMVYPGVHSSAAGSGKSQGFGGRGPIGR